MNLLWEFMLSQCSSVGKCNQFCIVYRWVVIKKKPYSNFPQLFIFLLICKTKPSRTGLSKGVGLQSLQPRVPAVPTTMVLGTLLCAPLPLVNAAVPSTASTHIFTVLWQPGCCGRAFVNPWMDSFLYVLRRKRKSVLLAIQNSKTPFKMESCCGILA